MKTKHIQGRWLNFLKLLVLSALACYFPVSALAKERCPEEILSLLMEKLSIFDADRQIRDVQCKTWPNDENRMLSVLAYVPIDEIDRHIEIPFAIAFVQLSPLKILNVYLGNTNTDATRRVIDGYFSIDTAKYQLSNDARAFALREGGFVEISGMPAGNEDKFSLYVFERGGSIRKILEIPFLRFWSYAYNAESHCDTRRADASPYRILNISVLNTHSHGYHDLMVTARKEGLTKALFRQKLEYNGKIYKTENLIKKIRYWAYENNNGC